MVVMVATVKISLSSSRLARLKDNFYAEGTLLLPLIIEEGPDAQRLDVTNYNDTATFPTVGGGELLVRRRRDAAQYPSRMRLNSRQQWMAPPPIRLDATTPLMVVIGNNAVNALSFSSRAAGRGHLGFLARDPIREVVRQK